MASTDETLRLMNEIHEARAAAIKPLAKVLEEREKLRRQLAMTDEPYGKTYVDAVAAGWTAEELQKLGADEPAKRPRGRSKGRRGAAAKKPAGRAPETAPEGGSATGSIPPQDVLSTTGDTGLGTTSG